jgi:hypothetical protein
MKKIVRKKIVSSLLVAFLLNQSCSITLYATDLSTILLKNSTYAGTWEDPTSGMKYVTGGGIKIKFKTSSNTYTPWVKGTMPNYSIGCNGISLSGGFIGLLGLSDIEEQLKDSGAAFAWGILSGLAYSVPVISDIFAKIQRYARTLQQLIQNACSIGQNLARNSPAKSKIDAALHDSVIKKGFDKVNEFMDSMDEKFKVLDEFVQCNGDANCTKKRDNVIGEWFATLFGITSDKGVDNSSGGVVSSSIRNVKDAVTNVGAYYKEVPLHELLNTSNGYIDLTENDILNIKLSLIFFGDIALSKEPRAEIAKHFKSDGSLDEDAMKKTGKDLLSSAKQLSLKKFELVSPEITDISKVVNILINGAEETLYVPDYKVGILVLPSKDTGTKNTTMTFLIKELDTANSNHTNLKLDWAGFYKEGVKQIFANLNQTNSGTTDVLLNIPVDTTITSGEITDEYVPVLIPQFNAYVKDIRKTIQTDPSKKFSAQKVALKMAQVNAALATNDLTDEIIARIKKVAFNSTEQKEVFIEFLKELGMKREAIIKKVEEVYSKEKDVAQSLENEIEQIVNKAKEKALK